MVSSETDGGNGYIIDAGHRRVKQAIAAGLAEVASIVADAVDDDGAMRSMVENIAREPLIRPGRVRLPRSSDGKLQHFRED